MITALGRGGHGGSLSRVRARRRTVLRLAAAPVAIAVAVTAFVVAGRLGQERLSKSQYEEKVQLVYADVQQAFRETNVKAPAELVVRVGAAQEQLREAARQLDAVEPPKAVQAANDEIVAGMRAYADDLDGLRDAASLGDRGAIENFTAKIAANEAVRQIAAAAQELELKGYEVGALAGE
jgi:hypothetical protein